MNGNRHARSLLCQADLAVLSDHELWCLHCNRITDAMMIVDELMRRGALPARQRAKKNLHVVRRQRDEVFHHWWNPSSR